MAQATKDKAGHITRLTPQQAHDMIEGQHPRVIDVRPEGMYRRGHLVDAVDYPLPDIDAESAKEVIGALDTPVVVYCQTGVHSSLAARELESLGYTCVYDMEGGISAWPYEVAQN